METLTEAPPADAKKQETKNQTDATRNQPASGNQRSTVIPERVIRPMGSVIGEEG